MKRETCISGCRTLDELDLMDIGSYVELPGGNVMFRKGYSSIVPIMSENIPEGIILTKHPVKSIRWKNKVHLCDKDSGLGPDLDFSDTKSEGNDSDSDTSEKTVIDTHDRDRDSRSPLDLDSLSVDGGDNSSQHGSSLDEDDEDEIRGQVQVECENGKIFYCDHVICTVPLGVLKKKANTLFNPPLPQYKLDSINNLLFEPVDKIYLMYERPFLPQNVSEVITLWNVGEDSSQDDPPNIKDCWYKKIYSFVKCKDTILQAWCSGLEAEYLETLSQEEIGDTCTQILKKFLRDPFIPKPINVMW